MPPGVVGQDAMIFRETPNLRPEIPSAARKAMRQHDAGPGPLNLMMERDRNCLLRAHSSPFWNSADLAPTGTSMRDRSGMIPCRVWIVPI